MREILNTVRIRLGVTTHPFSGAQENKEAHTHGFLPTRSQRNFTVIAGLFISAPMGEHTITAVCTARDAIRVDEGQIIELSPGALTRIQESGYADYYELRYK